MDNPQRKKVTVPAVRAMKNKSRIGMLTAYDYPSAKVADAAGADVILVGDSLAMVVLGLPDTLSVTVDDMLHHTRAVVRGVKSALIVADMPYLSYHVSLEESVRNAGRFIQAGAHAVKVEGAKESRIERSRRSSTPRSRSWATSGSHRNPSTPSADSNCKARTRTTRAASSGRPLRSNALAASRSSSNAFRPSSRR